MPDGRFKKKVTLRKNVCEKLVEEKTPLYVQQRRPELKPVPGQDSVQVNFEEGDVSAFEGRFCQTALKDRFRLRRARVEFTGDFAEQFDFREFGRRL